MTVTKKEEYNQEKVGWAGVVGVDVSVSSAGCGWLISGRVVTYSDEEGKSSEVQGG